MERRRPIETSSRRFGAATSARSARLTAHQNELHFQLRACQVKDEAATAEVVQRRGCSARVAASLQRSIGAPHVALRHLAEHRARPRARRAPHGPDVVARSGRDGRRVTVRRRRPISTRRASLGGPLGRRAATVPQRPTSALEAPSTAARVCEPRSPSSLRCNSEVIVLANIDGLSGEEGLRHPRSYRPPTNGCCSTARSKMRSDPADASSPKRCDVTVRDLASLECRKSSSS